MAGWLTNLLYLAALAVYAPVLLWRAVRQGKYRSGWGEKLLGRLPQRDGKGVCVWFHAVSVGEVLLLRTVIEGVRRERGDLEIWVSTTTHTGHALAREKYPDCRVVYFPLDLTWAVRTAIRRVRPGLIALAELELWPNFVREAHALAIPLVLVNGRISARSFRGYRCIRPLMRSTLRRFARLGVQTEEYRQRLLRLGACGQRTIVTGSVKFDGVQADRNNPATRALRHALGIADGERVFVAGSTHPPEEELALACYRELRREFPALRLVLAPRHQERFEEVANLVAAAGLTLRRRSAARGGGSTAATGEPPVLLLDTLGELSAGWGLAEVAFVGGSLSLRGGQNMLEPCAYGAAVLFGPNTWNFRHAVDLLLTREAAEVVRNADELSAAVRRLLRDPDSARRMGTDARNVVLSQQGATRRTIELLLEALPPADARRSRAA